MGLQNCFDHVSNIDILVLSFLEQDISLVHRFFPLPHDSHGAVGVKEMISDFRNTA